MSVKLQNGEIPNVRLHDVLYVPDLSNSLLSVPSMTKRGAQILFSGDQCTIMKGSKVFGKSATSGNVLSIEVARSETAQVALSEKSMKLWHGRFGHVSVQSLPQAVKQFSGWGIMRTRSSTVRAFRSQLTSRQSYFKLCTVMFVDQWKQTHLVVRDTS